MGSRPPRPDRPQGVRARRIRWNTARWNTTPGLPVAPKTRTVLPSRPIRLPRDALLIRSPRSGPRAERAGLYRTDAGPGGRAPAGGGRAGPARFRADGVG